MESGSGSPLTRQKHSRGAARTTDGAGVQNRKVSTVLNGALLPLAILETFFLVVVWRCHCHGPSWSDPLLYFWLAGVFVVVETVRRGFPLNLRHLIVIAPGLIVYEYFPRVPTIIALVAIGWVLLTTVQRKREVGEASGPSSEEPLASR